MNMGFIFLSISILLFSFTFWLWRLRQDRITSFEVKTQFTTNDSFEVEISPLLPTPNPVIAWLKPRGPILHSLPFPLPVTFIAGEAALPKKVYIGDSRNILLNLRPKILTPNYYNAEEAMPSQMLCNGRQETSKQRRETGATSTHAL